MTALRKRQVLAAVLAAVLLFQGGSLVIDRLHDAWQVYNTIIQPAVWRNANFYQSQNFADYILFLNQTIPEDSRVVLPPAGIGPGAVSHTPAMQFFLSPREVINCPDVESSCAADLAAGGAYILVIGSRFPGETVLGEGERLISFNDTWGVYTPPGGPARNPAAPQPFQSLPGAAWAFLVPFLGLALMIAASWPAAARLAPVLPFWSQLAIGYGLYFTWLTLLLYLALLSGRSLTPGIVLIISLVWVLLNILLLIAPKHAPVISFRAAFHDWRRDLPWLAALLLLSGLAAVTAAGKGYHTTDAIVLWGAKGYGIAAHGLQAGAAETGTRTTAYPLNIPLSIAAFQALFEERLPASKLIFPGYGLALGLLIYGFLRRRASPRIAGLAALAFVTTPLFQRHAAIAYANLPLALSYTGGVLLAAWAEAEPNPQNRRKLRLAAGLFFVLAAWIRPEGLALSVLAALFLAGRALWLGSDHDRPGAAALIIPLVVYAAFWMLTSPLVYGGQTTTDEAGRAALNGIASGNLHLNELFYLLRYFAGQWFDLQTWGLVGFILFALLILVLFNRSYAFRNPFAGPLLIGLSVLAAFLGIYYLLSFDPTHDLSWWLSTGFTRMILPGVVLLWTGLIGFYLSEPAQGS